MKPIFTNYGQSLTETLPGCCGPLARRLSPKPQPKVIKLLKIKIIICDSINLVKIVKEEDYINFSTNNVCCSLHLHRSICDFLSCLYTLIIVELLCRPIWSVLGLGDSACCFYERSAHKWTMFQLSSKGVSMPQRTRNYTDFQKSKL